MEMIKKVALVFGVLLFSVTGFSQEIDTLKNRNDTINIPKRTIAYVADKFAVVRPLNIEFSLPAHYNFTPKLGKSKLQDGRMTGFSQLKVSANANFLKKKTWMLGATLGYRYIGTESNMFEPVTNNPVVTKEDFHYIFSSINFTYFSMLFNKPVIYSSSVIGEGSDRHFERVKGLLSGVMVLKGTSETKMMAGLVANIDPTAQLPVIPLFTYEHQIDSMMMIEVTLPKSVYLRKSLFKKTGRVSLGAELDQTTFYVYHIDGSNPDQRFQYRQLDINAGVVYEQAVGDFILTGKTGVKLTPSGRLFKKEDSFKDPVFEIKPNPVFYFNVGVSFNPFTLLKKRP